MNTHNIRAMRVLRERRAEQQRRACERMQQRPESGKLLPRTVVIDEWHVDSDGNMCRSMGAES